MGPNSLLIVPAGFDPVTGFGGFSTQGLTHTEGTALAPVPSGGGFVGTDTITDLVGCQGTIIAAQSGSITLTVGWFSGTGLVALGTEISRSTIHYRA